jgi:hypothetical protein
VPTSADAPVGAGAPVGADAPAEAGLLADALGVGAGDLRVLSREPLGRGSVAGFDVRRDDDATETWFVDTSGLEVAQETGLAAEGVRVWPHPADPHLPALAPAAFGGAAAVLLERLGVAVEGQPRIVAYRAGRRAVLRMPSAGAATWVKVVRPGRVERVVRAHAAFAAAGIPVPAVRGWSPEGLLVLDQAAGIPATEVGWRPEALLDLVDELRRRIATVPLRAPARTSLLARLPWYRARLIAAGLPMARVDDLAARAEALGGRAGGAETGIHGDLHIGQLFLTGSGDSIHLASLIDVDTAGRGDPADDAGAFLSHAVASALLTEGWGDAERAWALAEGARRRFAHDPAVAARAIVQLLGHALAAAESADRVRADRLLAAADLVDKSGLTVAFEAP